MMDPRYYPGVNHALFNRKAEEDGQMDFRPEAQVDHDGSNDDWRAQRKRRRGNKPPWLRHRKQDDRLAR